MAQGASLLGGALPGGSIVSAAISSVSALAGSSGSGAAAASYARTAAVAWQGKDDDCDGVAELADGNYVLEFVVAEKAASGLKDTLKTQVRIAFSNVNNVLKTKHDTAKNSISNVR